MNRIESMSTDQIERAIQSNRQNWEAFKRTRDYSLEIDDCVEESFFLNDLALRHLLSKYKGEE